MEKIKIAITGRVASIAALPEVVADNAEYEVDFALDPREGWDMSLPITALFVRRDGSYTARILDAGATSCTMPPQTGTNIVFVGLTQDDMRTTTPATIKVHRSIRTVANDPLPAPTEDVYAQILEAYAGIKILSGKGAPTSATQGKVNQLYRDEDTQKLYICTATDGGYTWAEVSGGGSGGGSVDIDATLTKAGQAADAKAAGDAIGKKIDKAQGTGNAGKILGIGADGNVTPQDKPVQALAGASAPTTATAGVVGQEYYVIVGNAVTEMYVCTAVANGTYTWGKVEFGAEESDPTVPAWAKEAQKPSYTASEVGADPSGTASSQVSAHNTGTDTHGDIRLLISGLTDRLNALADSDDTTLDQLSEVVAYIKSNRSLIEAITTSKVSVADIVDNLTTNVANKPLSAAQGVALKALIDALTEAMPEAYTLPIASSSQLGGVQPVAKTDAMTQSVGVDEAGGLWAVPGSGGGSWHTIGTQMMDGVETAVFFDLAGETIIQIIVTANWGTALTATKATVSLTLENGATVEFTTQTMNATSYTPKNIFTIFGNSKNCRQMIFSKAEGSGYNQVQGSFGVAYGYDRYAEKIVEDAIATGITITFDKAPSNAAIVKVEGM